MAGTSLLDAGTVATIRRLEADGWATRLAVNGQTCTILIPSQTVNPVTGYAPTYTPSATVPCVISEGQIQSSERDLGGAVRAQGQREIWVPTGTVVSSDDRIRDQAGTEYEIVSPVVGPASPTAPSFVVTVSVVT